VTAAETATPRSGSGKTVPAAAAALAGALLAGMTAAGTISWYLPAAALLLALAAFRKPWTVLALMLFLAVLGGYEAKNALAPLPELGPRDFTSQLTLVLDDARISSLPGLNGESRTVRAKLRSFTDPATGKRSSGGDSSVVLMLPEGTSIPPYGTVVEARGTVSPLAGSGHRDEFLDRLKRRGAVAAVRIDDWRTCGREAGVRGTLADWRDAMLARLFDGVRRAEVRQLAAALYCGVVSGMPGEVRREFGAAGIIHIFSVSGIHVAVLALCFALLLRSLPFRVRFPVLAVLVWGYVLMTGAGTPAVRAGAMVTLWALLRVCLLRLRGIDVLCWTAALMLAVDPLLCIDAGAQYSFLITGALLLLAERRRGKDSPPREADFVQDHFTSRPKRFIDRKLKYFRMVAAGAVTAFLAGAAVSIHNGRRQLGTGAVAANVLLAAAMPIFFVLFFVQLGMGLCQAGRFTAPLFERAFLGLRDFAAFFAGNFPDAGLAPPHPAVTLIYILALFALLCAGRRSVRYAAGGVLAIIVVWQLAKPYTLPPAVLVHAAEYGRPPLVAAADPARRRAVVVNAPDAGSARRAAEFLRLRGIREVEVLTSSSRDGAPKAGMDALKRELAIRQIRVSDAEKAASNGDPCRITPFENGFRLDYFDPGSKLYFGVAVTAGDSGYEAVAERGNFRARRLLPWSIDREEWIYEFTE